MYLFGLANTIPEHLMNWLVLKHIVQDHSEVAVLPMDSRLECKRPKRKFILGLSGDSIQRNLHVLNSKSFSDVTVFLFGAAIELSEFSSLVPLDYEKTELSPVKFEEITLSVSRYRAGQRPAICVKQKIDYLKLLSDRIKVGSLLNPLMTFLYTLPSSTHQTPVKNIVALYLYHCLSDSKLDQMLSNLDVPITSRMRTRLYEILESDAGCNYREAFKSYGRLGLEKTCQQNSVNSYEISYIVSVAESIK